MDENFRYKTSNYSFHYVLRQIESGRMEVNPDFKDLKRWSIREKSLYIESVLLGIPTQPIWCEETHSGDYIVIEGSERLAALFDFIQGRFSLTHLKIRKEYRDLGFESLPYHERIALEDRYPFTFIVINYDTPYQLKCEFFRRLLDDTGNHNDQSARNFAWNDAFIFLQKIKRECAELIEFVPRNPRGHQVISGTKSQSEIDEFFLFLLMIHSILDGQTFENAYLDDSMSVDDLLDWTMGYFDSRSSDRRGAKNAILSALSDIRDHQGTISQVMLGRTLRGTSLAEKSLPLPEFYLMFIKACSQKFYKPIDWSAARRLRNIKNISARNFISNIFQARNA
jgi:hypothetical protein